MNEMFAKFPGFNWRTSTQEAWGTLYWTDNDIEQYEEWAVSYLRKKGFTKTQAKREISWLLLQYSPRQLKNPKISMVRRTYNIIS